MNYFILLIFYVCSVYGNSNSNLLSVVLVYRHGDRTPTDFSPKDEYKDRRFWSTEPGELTNLGKRQHYALGGWLKNRYVGFLPPIYHKTDIYVRSTTTDRCLMSAAANLAGLYPPYQDQIWNNNLNWMPIPIHSVPLEDDNLLKMGKACPNFKYIYRQLMKNDNFTAIDKENKELYKYLTENLGEKIKTFADIEKSHDTMTIEAEHNMKLPNWTQKILPNGNKVFPDEMKKWADLSYETPTYTEELARLGTGRFFDTLASQFEAILNNDTEKRLADKMVMFSAHKSTVCDLTHTLGVFRLTPYAGALIFELRRRPDGHNKPYVNTLFKNGSQLENLQINGCDVDCDFDKFLKILKPYRLSQDQWEAECLPGIKSSAGVFSRIDNRVTLIFSIILAFILNNLL